MDYQVYVQEKFYKTITADNVQKVLVEVSNDIKQNKVSEFDATKPQNIRITPVNS